MEKPVIDIFNLLDELFVHGFPKKLLTDPKENKEKLAVVSQNTQARQEDRFLLRQTLDIRFACRDLNGLNAYLR